MRYPLIDDGELAEPAWATINEQVATAGWRRSARAVPAALATVVLLAWRTSRRWTALAATAHLAAGALQAVGLFAVADAFTTLLDGAPNPDRLLDSVPSLLLVGLAHTARTTVGAVAHLAQAALAPRVEYAARHGIHRAVLDVAPVAFSDADFVELVRQGGMHGVWAVRRSVQAASDLLAALVALAVALAVVTTFHPWLLPALLLAAAANGWAAMRAARLSYTSFLRMVARDRQAWLVGDLITGAESAMEVRAFLLEEVLLDEHARVSERLNADAVRTEARCAAIRLGGRALAAAGGLGAYCTLGVLLYTQQVPLSLAGTAVVAISGAAASLSQAIREFNAMYENSFYIDLRARLLDECRRRRGAARSRSAPPDPATITLRGVTFAYPGQHEPAVRDVDLTLRRGQVVALVGENGSGKSTLSRLICGLFTPDTGQVLWDDVDLATAAPPRTSLIAQDPVRWPVSAATNICISDLDGERARWPDSARTAGADTLIEALPRREDTVLSTLFAGGHGLSTGQWQRIAAARGHFRTAPLLIADEPTASLDALAEARVFDALCGNEGASNRTTVLVTHRLGNVRNADLIVVLERGRIVATGTHAELISRPGPYRLLYDSASEGSAAR
ncbi:ATP-binding cassette domain-containing protein [Actinokineospora bangkokensis]|uniref:ABC transporter ATP-binding protein n=1 Tax=Actinokineospora bangkokensis TaxID=1193682 RepID=A0A1Q9LII0_9PSEU|nr:ABC transporter ATP-binding protein [Actinokineospora bangkokensis]OLR91862.1 hypothetical protein BJP25_23795 [Actinokineospora bangkokensis]